MRAARSDAPVLVCGERGTGKGLVARAIHLHSRRREGPLVAVNIAELPPDAIERVLFGPASGTVRPRGCLHAAESGTLLLDRIDAAPPPLQARLVRVLEERELSSGELPRARLISLLEGSPETAVASGRLRQDLYLRLNVLPIWLAPLRERAKDVPLLVRHFVERFSHELGVTPLPPPRATLGRLAAHSWPGNVRELENAVQRALVLGWDELDGMLDRRLPEIDSPEQDWARLACREFGSLLGSEQGARDGRDAGPYWSLVRRLEGAVIEEALARAKGVQIEAARLLGISRNTLHKKLVDLGIPSSEAPSAARSPAGS